MGLSKFKGGKKIDAREAVGGLGLVPDTIGVSSIGTRGYGTIYL
ncbi:MAG: hypothetical protein Ta2B_26960 [Termitinemataceae bacterium]|nr:MAG: hypothetical protein Ta2B_26960 [Termitinemataceae bacterium]